MLKTLGAQIKEFKKDSIKTPLFMILEVLMEMLIPFLMASIIDDGVEKGDIRHICIIGGWMIVAALIGLYAGIMGGVCGATMLPQDLQETCGKPCMKTFRQFSFSNIDQVQYRRTGHTTDHGCNQCTECIPDAASHVCACADQHGLCDDHVLFISMQNWQVFIWWQLLFWAHACSLSSARRPNIFRKYLKNMMI